MSNIIYVVRRSSDSNARVGVYVYSTRKRPLLELPKGRRAGCPTDSGVAVTGAPNELSDTAHASFGLFFYMKLKQKKTTGKGNNYESWSERLGI